MAYTYRNQEQIFEKREQNNGKKKQNKTKKGTKQTKLNKKGTTFQGKKTLDRRGEGAKGLPPYPMHAAEHLYSIYYTLTDHMIYWPVVVVLSVGEPGQDEGVQLDRVLVPLKQAFLMKGLLDGL